MTQKKVPQMSLCQCESVTMKSVSYKNNEKNYAHIYTVAQLRS